MIPPPSLCATQSLRQPPVHFLCLEFAFSRDYTNAVFSMYFVVVLPIFTQHSYSDINYQALVRKWSLWKSPSQLMETQNGTITLEKYLKFLQELNTHLICDPAIPLLAITQEKCKRIFMKTLVHECSKEFFCYSRKLGPRKCPSTEMGKYLVVCGCKGTRLNIEKQRRY